MKKNIIFPIIYKERMDFLVIEIQNLTKRFGNKVALDNVSFTVNKGEILGFLGPNGAGKSTTMNIITGYISSTEGTVKIDGHDILLEPIEAKKKIGYLPEQPPLYMDMTVDEYLSFVYEIKGCKLDKASHLDEIKEVVKIKDVEKRKIKNLSKGYKQRVGLAQALIGNPDVLILDEPTVGLDPKQIIEMRNLIKELGKDRTVILSSHIMQEISAVCERVIIINKGKIVASDTPENLSRRFSETNSVIARIEGDSFQVLDTINNIPEVTSAKIYSKKNDGVCDYLIESNTDIRRALFFEMAKINCPIIMLRSNELSLEEIFLTVTNDNAAAEQAQNPEGQAEGQAEELSGELEEGQKEQVNPGLSNNEKGEDNDESGI